MPSRYVVEYLNHLGIVAVVCREIGVAERGFAFLKDPLFLASSVFVKKPARIMALAFVMMLCLLVFKLAEVRVRQQLAVTRQTVPNQVRKPTARPTLRWLFQCFDWTYTADCCTNPD